MYRKSSNGGQQGSRGYGSRPPFRGGPRPASNGPRRFPSSNRFPNRSHNRGPQGENISHARFINKATITEEVEHFVPEHKFADFVIEENLKAGIIKKGYTLPTPIQDRYTRTSKGFD